jgi:hypothetical protein
LVSPAVWALGVFEALVPGGFTGFTGIDAEIPEMLMDRILGLSPDCDETEAKAL